MTRRPLRKSGNSTRSSTQKTSGNWLNHYPNRRALRSFSADWLSVYGWQPGAAELPLREGVVRVKYFKITKTWAVKAESEAEAIKLITADPVKYLDAESVSWTEYKKPPQK